MDRRRLYRRAAIAVASAWVLLVLLGAAWITLVTFLGDASCSAPNDDSNYGTHSWSLLPPGSRCTWTQQLNGFDRVDGPGWTGTAYVLWLASGAGLFIALRTAGKATE